MHAACRRGDARALRRLRKQGVDAALFDAALWDACVYGEVRAVRSLLEAGARADQRHEREGSLLAVSFVKGLIEHRSETAEVLQLLLARGPDLEARCQFGRTVLMVAAEHRHSPFFDLLLEQGADVEACDHWGVTALMRAAACGSAESVRALVMHGADPERREKQGRTALVHACARFEGYRAIDEALAALLQAGADLAATDHHGCGAVDYAAGQARAVLDRCAMDRARLGRADGMLFTAALDDDGRAVRAALADGARLDAVDALGRRARDIAYDRVHAKAALALERASIAAARLPASTSRLLRAAIRGDADSLRVALRRGAPPDARSPDGESALLLACFFHKKAAALALLDAGARPDLDRRLSPLLWAACHGDAELVARLLQAGAPTGTATSSGTTPLHFAAARRNAAMVKSLLLAGARPKRKDRSGHRPEWFALSGDATSTEVRRLLEEAASGRLCATERERGRAWSFHDCSICSAFPPYMHADLMKDERLPQASARLENIWGQYHSCPQCGTWYRYEHEYTYLAGGSEDDEALSRLGPVEAQAALRESRQQMDERRWQREQRNLTERYDRVVERLQGDVEGDDPGGIFAVRALVSHAIHRHRHEVAVALLKHASPRVRERAVHSVRALRASPFLEQLLKRLADEDPLVVRAALGAFHDEAMVRAGGEELLRAVNACPLDYYSVKLLWQAARTGADLSPAGDLIRKLRAHLRRGRSVTYGREALKIIDGRGRC